MINLAKRAGAALLAVALVVLAIGFSASPAAAEPSIRVTTVAGDRYFPGRPVAFQIEIAADRATDGTVIIRVDGAETAREEFALAGGTTKTIIVVTETLPWGPGFVVQVNSSDGDVTVRPGLREDRDSEAVGLLASLQTAGLPNTAPTATGGRTARFHPVTEPVLNADRRALGMFDSIAGTPDDFASLPIAAQESILQWIAQGGQLLVDAPAGTSVGLLGANAEARTLGFGSVRYTDGEMRRGNVDGLVPASSARTNDEFGQNIDPGQSGRTLVADAGISQPGIELLLLLIGGYIVLVGPVLFLALRRTGRQPLAWGVIPAVAAITVAAVWGVGRSQRSNIDLAHATIVASLGDITIERSEVLVASANGGFVGLATGDEYSTAAGATNRFGELSQVTLEERDGNVGIQLNPGEANRITVQRVRNAGAAPALQVSATIQDDRSLQGLVTNTSSLQLQDVRVVSGNAVQLVGTLEPGESVAVVLDDEFATVPFEQDNLYSRMQQEFFDPFEQPVGGEGDTLGSVNAGALAAFVRTYPEARFSGQVMALGWTREVSAPVRTDRGKEIDRGRTGFVTFEPIESANGPEVAFGEARVELVRIWDFQLNDRAGQRSEFPAELLINLPADARAEDVFVIELPQAIEGLDIWNGSTWAPSSEDVLPGLEDRIVVLTDDTLRQGQVHLRAGFSGFNQRELPIVRSATQQESDTIELLAQLAELEQ